MLLTLVVVRPAKAQIFPPDALSGAVIGGLIGCAIGHNSGRRTAEGIGIGAGSGLLLGAIAISALEGSPGAGYSPGYYSGTDYPLYVEQPGQTLNGAILGGIARGIIGHNSGRRTAEGLAIGAAGGFALGAIADDAARRGTMMQRVPGTIEPMVYVPAIKQTMATAQTVPAAETPAPESGTKPNAVQPGLPSRMSAANALFGR
ncbi:MAG: hypothetical protein EXS31_01085 [Pedosphaera sp.]|nr:hypothetical protein [Pedosphaera sp.]